MSFSITSYTPHREDSAAVDSHPFMREQIPFPTQAWRRMLTQVPQNGPAASDRKLHPAELALAEVESRFDRAVISINEAMEAEMKEHEGSDDWHPRAA